MLKKITKKGTRKDKLKYEIESVMEISRRKRKNVTTVKMECDNEMVH